MDDADARHTKRPQLQTASKNGQEHPSFTTLRLSWADTISYFRTLQ